ncbi:hypothetical protein [Sulfitobacter guttiformis]|uniref:hypothetical protein n=1 Tax=Sulfitobacter guttiformis TaxID=74349 RepID=UPI000AD105DC|nr:hypothetical protein [Sulfitobacter guttiformis]
MYSSKGGITSSASNCFAKGLGRALSVSDKTCVLVNRTIIKVADVGEEKAHDS